MNEFEEDKLQNLRAKINKSMEQLVIMVLQVKKRVDSLDERIEIFNKKAGHRI